MDAIKEVVNRIRKRAHGFLAIQREAEEVVNGYPPKESLRVARELFASDIYQARMLATFIGGQLAANSREGLKFLKLHVSRDKDWRVQEILAKSLDKHCAGIGYEQALPVIEDWLADPSLTVRRAVTEGLRIWTARRYFREHPEVAVQMLSRLRHDESEYVRKSVGNALRDISRKHAELVRTELLRWDTAKSEIAQTFKQASRCMNGQCVNYQ